MTRPEDSFGQRQLGAYLLGLLTVSLVLSVYAMHGTMQTNPIQLPFEDRVRARLWAPEGWRFFTKDPRDERPLPFHHSASGWTSASLGPNSRTENAFGIDRRGRAQGVELGLLLSAVPKTAWRECKERPESCLERAPQGLSVRNISPDPSLCGEVGLAMQKPVPWAWSRHPVIMPSRIVRLEVTC